MALLNNKNGKTKTQVMVTAIFVVVVLIAVSILLFFSAQAPGYTVDGEKLTISGIYGQTIQMSDIQSVKMENGLPDNLWKKSGSNFGSRLKGTFGSSMGDVSLYVNQKESSFIYLTTSSGKTIIVNDESDSKTQELFDKLNSAKKS